jgi:hypothetical protein
MKALKILVIAMTLAMVAGLGLLGWGLMEKGRKIASGPATAPVTAAAPTIAVFDTVTVPLPAGAHVEQMSVAGDRVVLRITGGGGERVVVLDPLAGRIAGTFVLAPAPR